MGKKYAKEPLSTPQFLKRGQNTIKLWKGFLNS